MWTPNVKKRSELYINGNKENGQNWNRTSDTRIFSPPLYRLSYLAKQNLKGLLNSGCEGERYAKCDFYANTFLFSFFLSLILLLFREACLHQLALYVAESYPSLCSQPLSTEGHLHPHFSFWAQLFPFPLLQV